jgi:serine/threonine protein kinase
MKTNYYQLLEVQPTATLAVIEAAYRTLVGRVQSEPDCLAKERVLHEAFEMLSDSRTREAYDIKVRGLGKDAEIGNYKVIEEIAKGGFAVTYRARHVHLEEDACIKQCLFVSTADTQILKAEAKTVWNLRHPSLPSVRDMVLMEDGTFVMIMSYVPGLTLHKYVQKHGKLSAEDTCFIASRIVNALQYMHYHGVVHGDIKPANVILPPSQDKTSTANAVLVDFGLSSVKPSKSSRPLGYTRFYAPPEQEAAAGPLLPESDLYSLGMTMIYALSGSEDAVQEKEVPDSIPKVLKEFIYNAIREDVLKRPNLQHYELTREFSKMRLAAFGRENNVMKLLS